MKTKKKLQLGKSTIRDLSNEKINGGRMMQSETNNGQDCCCSHFTGCETLTK